MGEFLLNYKKYIKGEIPFNMVGELISPMLRIRDSKMNKERFDKYFEKTFIKSFFNNIDGGVKKYINGIMLENLQIYRLNDVYFMKINNTLGIVKNNLYYNVLLMENISDESDILEIINNII